MPTPDILPLATALAATDSSLGTFQLTVETHREELEDDTVVPRHRPVQGAGGLQQGAGHPPRRQGWPAEGGH